MRETICAAIAERRLLRFIYDGSARLVEPYCYGTSTRGNRALRGYQTWSAALTDPGWRLFREDKMSHPFLMDERFDEDARPEYRRDDHQLVEVLCRV